MLGTTFLGKLYEVAVIGLSLWYGFRETKNMTRKEVLSGFCRSLKAIGVVFAVFFCLSFAITTYDEHMNLVTANLSLKSANDRFKRDNEHLRSDRDYWKEKAEYKPAAKRTVSAAPQLPPSEVPLLANIRIASQRRVVSDDPDYPFALEVAVQTTQTIEPVAFLFKCSGDVGKGKGSIGPGAYTKTDRGGIADHPNWYAIEWETPAFTPDKVMVVTLFSKTAITVQSFERFEYRWPMDRR